MLNDDKSREIWMDTFQDLYDQSTWDLTQIRFDQIDCAQICSEDFQNSRLLGDNNLKYFMQ